MGCGGVSAGDGGFKGDPALWRVLAGAADVAALLWEKGWAEANAGNLSCDVTDVAWDAREAERMLPLPAAFPELGGRRILVTGAGSRMRELAREPERFCGVLDLAPDGASGGVLRADAGRGFAPTSELPSHLAIHAALRRRGLPQRAVVHTHPTELLALSHDAALLEADRLSRALCSMHPEVILAAPDGVALVRYLPPGSAEQGAAAGAAMERHRVALWEKHGAVAVGADFAEAFDRIDVVNKAARLLLLCRAARYDPDGLTAAQVEEVRRATS